MNRSIIFLCAISSAVVLFACNRIQAFGFGERGSGNARTEQREVRNFNAVDVGGAFDVEITAGGQSSVEVSADDNLLQYVETSVSGNTLRIKTTKNISPKSPLKVRITVPDLVDLNSSGASDVVIRQVNNEKLHIETSGAGSVQASVQTKKLNVETSGAGNVKLEGSAQTFVIETSGAADIKARNLQAQTVKVAVSGAGDVEVSVSEQLDAQVSGAGDISYYGNPKVVNQHTSGAGSIRKKG